MAAERLVANRRDGWAVTPVARSQIHGLNRLCAERSDEAFLYGYKWWLYGYQDQGEDRVAFAGSGFGGQLPIVLPELDLVLVFTGWNILPDRPELKTQVLIERILQAVK